MSEIFCFKTSKIDLDLDHISLKINKEDLSLESYRLSSTVASLATFKQSGQKIMSWHHLVYKPTHMCKTIYPLFSQGHKKYFYIQTYFALPDAKLGDTD